MHEGAEPRSACPSCPLATFVVSWFHLFAVKSTTQRRKGAGEGCAYASAAGERRALRAPWRAAPAGLALAVRAVEPRPLSKEETAPSPSGSCNTHRTAPDDGLSKEETAPSPSGGGAGVGALPPRASRLTPLTLHRAELFAPRHPGIDPTTSPLHKGSTTKDTKCTKGQNYKAQFLRVPW